MLLHAAMQGVTVSVGYEGILRRLRLEVTAIKFSLVSVKNATTPLNEGRREYHLENRKQSVSPTADQKKKFVDSRIRTCAG